MPSEEIGVKLTLRGRKEMSRGLRDTADDLGKLGDKADDAATKANKTEGKWKKYGAAVGAAAAVGATALAALAVTSVKSASDLEQSFGGVESVFGNAAGTVKAFAEGAAQNVGLAKSEYASLASVVGSQLQRMGQSQAESAESTDKLISLGADLAATYGGSVADAVGAVGSLLRGERDPIERYAVGIKDADIQARLAADGLGNLEGAAKTQAESQATLALLFEQTANAQGAFGRESDTLAGQQERLRAQVENVKASIGTALLPVLTDLASFVNESVIPAISSMAGWIDNNRTTIGLAIGAIGLLTGAVVAHSIALGIAAAGSLPAYLAATTLGGVVTSTWAAAQWVLNAAMTANPIGLIVVGIAALVAGFALAYNKSETFREALQSLWEKIKAVGSAIADSPLGKAFGAVVSTFTGGDEKPEKRAAGGPVRAGQPYIVGEQRPELFVPNTSGVIVPRVPDTITPAQPGLRVPRALGSDGASLGGGVTGDLHITLEVDGERMATKVVRSFRKNPHPVLDVVEDGVYGREARR